MSSTEWNRYAHIWTDVNQSSTVHVLGCTIDVVLGNWIASLVQMLVFTLGEPAEASARDGEHRRHPRAGGGAVQRQKRLHAEARLNGRPVRRRMPSPPVKDGSRTGE
jgi:hypothetical protein